MGKSSLVLSKVARMWNDAYNEVFSAGEKSFEGKKYLEWCNGRIKRTRRKTNRQVKTVAFIMGSDVVSTKKLLGHSSAET